MDMVFEPLKQTQFREERKRNVLATHASQQTSNYLLKEYSSVGIVRRNILHVDLDNRPHFIQTLSDL